LVSWYQNVSILDFIGAKVEQTLQLYMTEEDNGEKYVPGVKKMVVRGICWGQKSFTNGTHF